MSQLQYLKGVGEQKAKLLAKLDLHTPQDLLSYFPRTYQDRSQLTVLFGAEAGRQVCIRAQVIRPLRESRFGKGKTMFTTRVGDGTGFCSLVFFNAPYLRNTLTEGEQYLFFGKLVEGKQGWEMVNPLFEKEGVGRLLGRIVPVYWLTQGVNSGFLAACVEQVLRDTTQRPAEILPEPLRDEYKLCHVDFAYRHIHFPDDEQTLVMARRRLVFEELLLMALGVRRLRAGRATHAGPAVPDGDWRGFADRLPFTLTPDQQAAVDDAVADMQSGKAMHRLLQGDVGSGKTAVAAALAYVAAQNGLQTALMAPTELLASQHADSLRQLLPDCRVELCTGQLKAAERKRVQALVADGTADIVVGTQALLSESVAFAALGLVITDEQHRFGVEQRQLLSQKAGREPHVLVMSATPIPRSLALILYGDLDISVIKSMPAQRKPIDTFVVDERYRQRLQAFVRKLVGEGRQVYIVCPRVEPDEEGESQLKSAEQLAKELQDKVYPDLRVGLLHGKSKDKEKVMAAFARQESDILVATTVIEVGIDVPNAALMIVENADLFGLSQLHQLRGRVGRGAWQSYCILINSGGGGVAQQRLEVMAGTRDGFVIAEQDLKLRGPGDFFGDRQHGRALMKIADLANDAAVLKQATAAANTLTARDPELILAENQPLRHAVEQLMAHL